MALFCGVNRVEIKLSVAIIQLADSGTARAGS